MEQSKGTEHNYSGEHGKGIRNGEGNWMSAIVFQPVFE